MSSQIYIYGDITLPGRQKRETLSFFIIWVRYTTMLDEKLIINKTIKIINEIANDK